MPTDEATLQLKTKLIKLRDDGLQFLAYSERQLKDEMGAYYESVTFSPSEMAYAPEREYWDVLSSDYQERGQHLRIEVHQVMADVAVVAQRAILVDKADLITLGKNTKRMAASMRIRKFKSWGISIHHDEGDYIGSDPPGQSETASTVDVCRSEFLEALETTFELIQVFGARNEVSSFGAVSTATLKSYRAGTAFVMMRINPQQPELKDVRDTVVNVFKAFGIAALRADDLEHSEGITERIITEIKESEHLFADLTFERPSVYYEVGYAHALGKAPMLYRKKGTTIHFDLAYRNCPEYENLAQLRELLEKRLTQMTGRGPAYT